MCEFQGNGMGGGMFNTAVAPFDDVRGRLGLNKLNDQERVIEALGGTGISLPVTQWFSADSPWWTQEAADKVIEQVWSGSELVDVSLTQVDQATHINNTIAHSHKAHCWRWSGTRVARPRCWQRCRRFVV